MMIPAAMVDLETNLVVNIINLSTKKDSAPPGYKLVILWDGETPGIGWGYTDMKFHPPVDVELEALKQQIEDEAFEL
jgi:hypothetical protein